MVTVFPRSVAVATINFSFTEVQRLFAGSTDHPGPRDPIAPPHTNTHFFPPIYTSPQPSTPSTTPTPSHHWPHPPQATDGGRSEARSCSPHRLTQPSPVRCPSDRSWRPARWQRSRALDLSSPAGQRSTTPSGWGGGGSRGDNTNTLSVHIHKIKAKNGTCIIRYMYRVTHQHPHSTMCMYVSIET